MKTYTLVGVDYKTSEPVTLAVFDYRAAARRALKDHLINHKRLYRDYFIIEDNLQLEFSYEGN